MSDKRRKMLKRIPAMAAKYCEHLVDLSAITICDFDVLFVYMQTELLSIEVA